MLTQLSNNPVQYPYMTWRAKEQTYSVLVKSIQWSIVNAFGLMGY